MHFLCPQNIRNSKLPNQNPQHFFHCAHSSSPGIHHFGSSSSSIFEFSVPTISELINSPQNFHAHEVQSPSHLYSPKLSSGNGGLFVEKVDR
ncbi:hypothetical protein AKJ16_DCAP25100 [Drosera capensis]